MAKVRYFSHAVLMASVMMRLRIPSREGLNRRTANAETASATRKVTRRRERNMRGNYQRIRNRDPSSPGWSQGRDALRLGFFQEGGRGVGGEAGGGEGGENGGERPKEQGSGCVLPRGGARGGGGGVGVFLGRGGGGGGGGRGGLRGRAARDW